MKLNPKHQAILSELAYQSLDNTELTGLELLAVVRVPFLIFWTRKLRFSEIYPLLKELENFGCVSSRSDRESPEELTGACRSYYKFKKWD